MIAVKVRPSSSRALVLAASVALLAAAIGLTVEAWPAPVPLRVAVTVEPLEQAELTTYVPFRGGGWQDRGEDRCLAFLSEWAERPGWTLRLDHTLDHGPEDFFVEGVTLTPDGRATWITQHGFGRRGRTHAVMLHERDLAELMEAADDSCVPEPPQDDTMPSVHVAWLGQDWPDLRISRSPGFVRLFQWVEQVGDRYRASRLHRRGPFSITTRVASSASPWYPRRAVALTIDDAGQLLVRSGQRRGRSVLDRASLVAALDWIELDEAAPASMPRPLRTKVSSILRGEPL